MRKHRHRMNARGLSLRTKHYQLLSKSFHRRENQIFSALLAILTLGVVPYLQNMRIFKVKLEFAVKKRPCAKKLRYFTSNCL